MSPWRWFALRGVAGGLSSTATNDVTRVLQSHHRGRFAGRQPVAAASPRRAAPPHRRQSGSPNPGAATPTHCPRSGYGACLSLVRASDQDARDQCRHFAAEARRRRLGENDRRQARQEEKFLAWFVPKERIVMGRSGWRETNNRREKVGPSRPQVSLVRTAGGVVPLAHEQEMGFALEET